MGVSVGIVGVEQPRLDVVHEAHQCSLRATLEIALAFGVVAAGMALEGEVDSRARRPMGVQAHPSTIFGLVEVAPAHQGILPYVHQLVLALARTVAGFSKRSLKQTE